MEEESFLIRLMPQFLHRVCKLQSFVIFLAYLTLISLSGVWRRCTKPAETRRILVVYNFVCSAMSFYTMVRFGRHCLTARSLRQTDADIKYTFLCYWICKTFELLDTVFMILRHRGRQISFLHVFHHSSMIIVSEYCYRLTPRISMAVALGINSLVHVFLYLYYALSALNPKNPPQWKMRLTQLQIIQFVIAIVYGLYGYAYHQFCVYGLLYAGSMLVLFSDFYYRAYIKKSKQV